MVHATLAGIFFVVAIVYQVLAENPERIVGGLDAAPGQYPYQVSLRKYGQHICGGTLVSPKHVITAAHCIDDMVSPPFSNFTVVTGSISLTSGGEVHPVSQAVYNPDFKYSAQESYRNDIAIITLADTVSENRYQKPISVATDDPPVGAYVTLSGWGQLYLGGPLADILQGVKVNVLSNADCQNKIQDVHIYDSQLCTLRHAGVGACQGDSGGPLVYNNTLVGVVSWVFPCASGLPDVFTRVNKYFEFLNKAIGN